LRKFWSRTFVAAYRWSKCVSWQGEERGFYSAKSHLKRVPISSSLSSSGTRLYFFFSFYRRDSIWSALFFSDRNVPIKIDLTVTGHCGDCAAVTYPNSSLIVVQFVIADVFIFGPCIKIDLTVTGHCGDCAAVTYIQIPVWLLFNLWSLTYLSLDHASRNDGISTFPALCRAAEPKKHWPLCTIRTFSFCTTVVYLNGKTACESLPLTNTVCLHHSVASLA